MCAGSFEDQAQFFAEPVINLGFDEASGRRMAEQKCCYIRPRPEEENHTTDDASFISMYPQTADSTRMAAVSFALRKDSHERMREADFGSIDRAIAGCFE